MISKARPIGNRFVLAGGDEDCAPRSRNARPDRLVEGEPDGDGLLPGCAKKFKIFMNAA